VCNIRPDSTRQENLTCHLVDVCRYVKELMEATGLTVREDAMGNIFGRWQV
jgi:hypothetical protein